MEATEWASNPKSMHFQMYAQRMLNNADALVTLVLINNATVQHQRYGPKHRAPAKGCTRAEPSKGLDVTQDMCDQRKCDQGNRRHTWPAESSSGSITLTTPGCFSCGNGRQKMHL